MPGTYLEQLARTKRALDRMERIYSGRGPASDEECRDDVLAFFQNCHHLKDWLIHDSSKMYSKARVEGFINANRELALCADLCNGAKHLKRNSNRSGEDPQMGAQSVTVGSGGIAYSFIVDADLGRTDALDLARKCMALWLGFV